MQSVDLSSTLFVPPQYRYAHIKRDGINVELLRNRDKSSNRYRQWKAYTRRPTDITEHMKLVPSAARAFSIGLNGVDPPFNRIHGELFWVGHEAKDVKSALADKLYDQLSFEVHWLDVNFNGMEYALRDMQYLAGRYGLAFTNWLDLHEPHKSTARIDAENNPGWVFEPGKLSTSLLLEFRDVNSDGWVLKDSAYRYDNWLKLKPRVTADYEIIGYTDGKGKYAGLIGALVLRGGTKISGMDDATRRELTANKSRYLGTMVEVAYEKVIPGTKGLRHPRFVRLREDK